MMVMIIGKIFAKNLNYQSRTEFKDAIAPLSFRDMKKDCNIKN